MNRDEHFRRLERLYLGAPCNEYYRPEIHVAEGTCEVVIPVRQDFFHPAQSVHGAVYFKALDDAAFFAANSLVEDVLLLTSTFHVAFLRPVSSGEIRARGNVVHVSSRLLLADAVATDADGNVVARGTGTFMRTRIELTPALGYRLPA